MKLTTITSLMMVITFFCPEICSFCMFAMASTLVLHTLANGTEWIAKLHWLFHFVPWYQTKQLFYLSNVVVDGHWTWIRTSRFMPIEHRPFAMHGTPACTHTHGFSQVSSSLLLNSIKCIWVVFVLHSTINAFSSIYFLFNSKIKSATYAR